MRIEHLKLKPATGLVECLWREARSGLAGSPPPARAARKLRGMQDNIREINRIRILEGLVPFALF